jgi:hypothetical protein
MNVRPYSPSALLCLACVLGFGVASAQTAPPPVASPLPNLLNTDTYNASLAALTQLLVLAVLLENAFALLFNWRVFLTYFSLRGVRTIIMIVISLVVVLQFNLDIVASLIAVYRSNPATTVADGSGWLSKLITAMIVAGGSAGVNNILAALGYRNDRAETEEKRRPPKDQAWISVRAQRENAQGPIWVQVVESKVLDSATATISGTLGTRVPNLLELLWRNRDRFPANGGHVVRPNVSYEISLKSQDREGKPLDVPVGVYAFTPGAIVDFDVKI